MSIVQPKKFVKETFQTKIEASVPSEQTMSYPFQWMLFKPQLHAIAPFETNTNTRHSNVVQTESQSK
jgi:hypothetical protein